MSAASGRQPRARRVAIGVLLALLAGAATYGAYRLGIDRGMRMATVVAGGAGPGSDDVERKPAQAQGAAAGEEATRRHLQAGLKAGDVDPATGTRILYYHDPMVPATRFDKPGKSPFMNMMLLPVYESGRADAGVSISPRTQQSLGVRTAEVVTGRLSRQVDAIGSIAFNERDQAVIQARAAGFVERLHARATLDRVAKGQPLVDLHVPDWIAAQEEFLSVRRMAGSDMAGLVDAARQRMRLAGVDDEHIRSVERSGLTEARTTLRSPLAGVLVEVGAREGMTVAPGATLFRINGLGTVWANAEVPESQAGLVRRGAKVEATSPALQGETLAGTVQSILPDVNATTRTIRVRVELANPGARLVPGMLVQMKFVDVQGENALLVPSEAVIQTGTRSVVIVAEAEGRFSPVDVETGLEAGGRTEVRRGLRAGQRVVISSQFLIDSEASLRGVESRLGVGPAAAGGSVAASEPAHAHEHGASAASGGKR